MTYTSVVIAGGANKVLCSIGCCRYLEEQGKLSEAKHFIGTSAGAIICLCLCLGYNSYEMEQTLYSLITDPVISSIDVTEVFQFLETFGFTKGENLITAIRKILYKKTGKTDMRFIDVAKIKGKNLVVCVANVTKEREEFLSVDTTPELSIVTAIRMSCSIPFIFTPCTHEGMMYVDGAFYNNFPMDYIRQYHLKDYIGINILNACEHKCDTFFQYAYRLMCCSFNRINCKNIKEAEDNIVNVDIPDSEWFSFKTMTLTISEEMVKEMIKKGYEAIKAKLSL